MTLPTRPERRPRRKMIRAPMIQRTNQTVQPVVDDWQRLRNALQKLIEIASGWKKEGR